MEHWKYYNHALLSALPPHEEPDISQIANKLRTVSAKGKRPLFARWTTDFDCAQEMDWWYVIKDSTFSMDSVKAKRRYEINKGTRNFSVSIIDPKKYADSLCDVQIAAFSAYPEKYRPIVDRDAFAKSFASWDSYDLFGAFSKETGELCGYALLERVEQSYIRFSVQKAKPECEQYGINAALVYEVLMHYSEELKQGIYICDGERSVRHETEFQNYLEKYFGFRKAYCRLHMQYATGIGLLVKLLMPFREQLLKYNNHNIIHNINAVLLMESIHRNCIKTK